MSITIGKVETKLYNYIENIPDLCFYYLATTFYVTIDLLKVVM